MFDYPEQIPASFGIKVKPTCLSGWSTTMKPAFLVSVCGAIGLMTVLPALASTVTTEFGRPLLVEGVAAYESCSDVALSAGAEGQGWHDALASKRADDRLVHASWNNALAKTRAQDRAAALALVGSAMSCPLTN
jgi:hypothetical protein